MKKANNFIHNIVLFYKMFCLLHNVKIVIKKKNVYIEKYTNVVKLYIFHRPKPFFREATFSSNIHNRSDSTDTFAYHSTLFATVSMPDYPPH